MNCPRCQTRVASSQKFCGDCGEPLPWFCQACGIRNAPRNRFCVDCGAQSATISGGAQSSACESGPGSPEPERRQLTIMFADLIGSTTLGTRLEPEDFRDVMHAWRECVTGLVVRYGGRVTLHMGDGILAFFGYPRANEVDAERAVRSGLAIIEAVGHLHTGAGPPGTLSTRVGLATGPVIVGDLIGAGPSLEWSVVSETANLAARLQTLADPDTVVIDNVTRHLSGGMFEYADLGPTHLKGIPTSVQPWTVLRESAVESRFEALRTGQLPLVGREDEAGLLQRRWAKARSGIGQAVVLVGEAGLGKSRLIAAFEERTRDASRSVLRLSCSPHYQDTPLYPLIRYFDGAASFLRTDTPVQKFGKLQRLLGNTLGLGEEETAVLADLLSIPAPIEIPARWSSQRTKEVTFKAVLLHIKALASQAPLLAIVEDLHWADPTTIALLDTLVNEVEHFSTLLLISARPERGLMWSLHPQVTTRLLNGLDRSQAAVLIRQVAGEREFADDVVARIVERAQGVPLFLEELTRSILGSQPPEAGGARQTLTLPILGDAVPTSLNALLTARLDQLGAGKEVAQASSVIGREFSFEMLQVVSGLPTERLERALNELTQARVILPQGPPPNAIYVFYHVLIQDAAYASMLRDRRRAFHLRYAEALENDPAGPASRVPELLAVHFAEAGAAEKSVDYYLKAAARATGRFALIEIVGYLQKGLRQLAKLPATLATQHRELALQVAMGRALMEHRGAGDEEVRATFERAEELCLVLGGTEQLLHVHDGLANYHFAHSELDKLVEYAERALELGRRTGNRHAVVLAHRSSGHAKLLLGRFREARGDLEQAIAQYEGEMALTRDPKVSSCAALGICLTTLGLPDSGTARSMEAVRDAEKLSHPISLNLGLRRACVQGMLRRDAQHVLALSNRLLDNQTDYETFRGSREGVFFVTWAHLQTNRDPALRERLRATLDHFESTRCLNLLTFFMVAAAELMEDHGDLEGADTLLRRAAELVETTNERWCEPEIPRLRARLTTDPTASGCLLETSLSLAREQGALLWEVRGATDLAKLLRGQGGFEAARDILAPVLARVNEGLAIPDFTSARDLLRELGCPNG
ncbi:MAG: AAA family ATPase [Rhodopila sp.]|nr:AAA family ATPase [Rhodopila sp.]